MAKGTPNGQMTQFAVNFRNEDVEKLQKMAKTRGLSMAAMMRLAVLYYLKREYSNG